MTGSGEWTSEIRADEDEEMEDGNGEGGGGAEDGEGAPRAGPSRAGFDDDEDMYFD